MRSRARLGGMVAIAILAWAASTGAAFAEPIACQRAIVKAASAFTRARTQALAHCAEKKLAGKLLASQDCAVEPKTATRLVTAESKMRAAIAKACGGKNKTCAAGDTGDDADEPLAAIGWDVGTCPAVAGGGSCGTSIADCDDIATCLACVTPLVGGRPLSLSFDDAGPSQPGGRLNKCQIAIGSGTAALLAVSSKALGKCEDAILRGVAAGPCPSPGDGKAAEAIAKEQTKQSGAICRACGGADGTCGGGDDLGVSDIGFAASCPAVTVPDGESCAAPIAAPAGIVACTDCVTRFASRCLDAIAVPGLLDFPSECGPQSTPTPLPTQTATPTATPTVTATPTPPAGPGAVGCQRAIVKASAQFAVASVKARQQCEARKRAGTLPPATDCQVESGTAARLAKADAKLRGAVAKSCGGANKACNALDTGPAADEALAEIGWQIGSCPGLRGTGCTGPLVDCADIGACLGCTLDVGAADGIALYYASLQPAGTDAELVACQAAIGAQGTKFVAAKLRALAQCEDALLRGKIAGPCPFPGDGKAGPAIAKAETKMLAAICKACGGADHACGGVADLAISAIGAPSSCPAVAVPGGLACGGALTTLDDLVACVACVSEANVDCADFLALPGLKPYPAECRAAPTPTPGGVSPTPSPTATPGGGAVCGNGVPEAGEFCDDGNTANCDACPADCHAPPPDCASVQATRHTQPIRIDAPTEIGAVQVCLTYPAGTVGFPGTGTVGGRLSGFAGSNSVADFDNAAQIALLPAGSQSQFTFTLSFDRCTGASAPAAIDFACITKDASDTFGNSIVPPTVVECTPVAAP